MRAGIYVRISDDREGKGLGIARQEKDCRALCDARKWEVSGIYADNDISAYSGKRRPSYERMLADMQDGQLDVIVTWHTDRLHRSPIELERWISICDQRNIPAVSVMAGDLDMSTSTGRMVARMLGAAARHESERKSERALGKARQLAEHGQVGNGGYRPYGYHHDRVTVDEIEAAVLRECYARVVAGHSLRAICADLDTRGVTTTQGGRWSVQGLRYNLLTGRNAGLREHRRIIVGPAVWPAIIDRHTWELARAILLDPNRNSNPAFGQARKYLLTGFLHCGLCGKKLVPRRNAAGQRFGCKPVKDGGCGSIIVRYEPCEDYIVQAVLQHMTATIDLTPTEPRDETARLLEVIATAEARIVELVEVFGTDGNALALRAATNAEEKRIGQARTELAQVTTAIPTNDMRSAAATWPTLNLDQRRAILGALLDRIDVGPARPGNTFQYERLTLRWR